MEPVAEKETKTLINRFASTLSGAFKAFHLYRQDNKALDEIMQNLQARFQAAALNQSIIKLGITNRSIVYDGDPIGIKELTLHLASALRTLGIKELVFRAPLQGRHFFQFLSILTSKDPHEAKVEKLTPMIGSDEDKPIGLIPITSNSLLLRMPDELMERQLAPLRVPQSEGGPGFIEQLTEIQFQNLPDLFTWICGKAGELEKSLGDFIRNITDAAREGYFPWERFLKIFPIPMAQKEFFFNQIVATPAPRVRNETPFGLAFHPKARKGKQPPLNWFTLLTAFSKEDMKTRQDLYLAGSQQSGLQELELAEVLLADSGTNTHLGLRFLIRFLSQQNPVAAQEKALKMAIGVWLKYQNAQEDMQIMTLMSSLRNNLATPHNLNLTLFPLRNLTIESDMFGKISQYILSLGEVALPALIHALDAEQDRSMRKKLCHVIALIAKQRGVDFLLESIPKATPFLIRNIVMILGDVRHPNSVHALSNLISHTQKIVRIETLRSLGKIGSPDSLQALCHVLTHSNDLEEKRVSLDYLLHKKEASVIDTLARVAKQESTPPDWKKMIAAVLPPEKHG